MSQFATDHEKALRFAREFVADPDKRAQLKVQLCANGWPKLADMIDEAVAVSRALLALSERQAHIVQVLPLAPQPETITTSTHSPSESNNESNAAPQANTSPHLRSEERGNSVGMPAVAAPSASRDKEQSATPRTDVITDSEREGRGFTVKMKNPPAPCKKELRPATLLEELEIEASIVPNRRGELYRLAAQKIVQLERELSAAIERERLANMRADDADEAADASAKVIDDLQRQLTELSAVNHRLAANQIGLSVSATAPRFHAVGYVDAGSDVVHWEPGLEPKDACLLYVALDGTAK